MKNRYFSARPVPKAVKSSYIDGWYIHDHMPYVSDHVPTDTGLLDRDGNAIMRAPRPMGFIWDE